MKKYILVLCFIFMNVWAFAQETEPRKDLENAIGGAIAYSPNSGVDASLNFNALFRDDVVTYFQLTDKYSSDLQQSVFKKSKEHQVLLDSLNKLKLCRWKVGLDFYGYPWSGVKEYNLKTGGFDVFMSKNINNKLGDCPPQSTVLYGSQLIRFKQLSFIRNNPDKKSIPRNPNFNYSYEEHIFLPIPEEEAVKMENDKNNIEIYFLFNLVGRNQVTFKYASYSSFGEEKTFVFATSIRYVAETSKLRIIIINKETQYLYYDKIY